MPQATGSVVIFAFPVGHPHHGKSVSVGSQVEPMRFVNGELAVPAANAAQYATILTRFYGAAIKGSPEMEDLEAEYAKIEAERKRAAAKEAAERRAAAAAATAGGSTDTPKP